MNDTTSTTTSAPKARKAADKSARTRAREFALQALYQHMVGRNEASDIDAFTRDLSGFHKADSVHYDALLHGCVAQADALDTLITPLLDRPLVELSPIERGVLWIGAYELQHCLDVPWRVVINECIELAKDRRRSEQGASAQAIGPAQRRRRRSLRPGHQPQHADFPTRPAGRALLRDGAGQSRGRHGRRSPAR